MVAFFKTHMRVIALLLIFAWAAFPLIQERALGLSANLFTIAINLIFTASQLFWFSRAGELGGRLVAVRSWRISLAAAGLIVYAFLLFFNLHNWEEASKGSALTLRAALLEAPFRLWLFGSLLGFLIVMALWIADRVASFGLSRD